MSCVVSDAELLAAWERGYGQCAAEQGVQLLSLALPKMNRQGLETISLGERNRLLMLLRIRQYGPTAACVDSCPQCHERLDVEFPLESLIHDKAASVAQVSATWTSHRVTIRLPTLGDLCMIQDFAPGPSRQRALLRQCQVNVEGVPSPEEWPAEFVQRVAVKLAAADPGAETVLPLSCAQCGQSWRRRFDIVSYLWADVDRHARRLIGEVCQLAAAYGWSERDILGLSAWRRRLYLAGVRL